MNHKEAEDKKLAELYFSQVLTPEEEVEFEEHLLLCEICRNNILMLEMVKEALEELKTNEFRRKINEPFSRRYINKRAFFKIAAVTILLTGLTGLFYLLSVRIGKNRIESEISKGIEESASDRYHDDRSRIFLQQDTFSGSGRSEELNHLSEGFAPVPFFENIIRQSYRNGGITVLSPLNDTIRKIPVFKWADSGIQTLNLKIINNREEVIFSNKITNGTSPEITIPSGLYYWQLQSSDETLFTGRFVLVWSAPYKGKTSP